MTTEQLAVLSRETRIQCMVMARMLRYGGNGSSTTQELIHVAVRNARGANHDLVHCLERQAAQAVRS
jgi:hypothetical protein